MLAAVISALHVLSLGIGLGAVFADSFWGAAALLWIATGRTRLFGELDKGLASYLYNGFFWIKMALFGLIFALEIAPMATSFAGASRSGMAVHSTCDARRSWSASTTPRRRW